MMLAILNVESGTFICMGNLAIDPKRFQQQYFDCNMKNSIFSKNPKHLFRFMNIFPELLLLLKVKYETS